MRHPALLCALAALALSSPALSSDTTRIDVGGYKLNASLQGSGEPTVVFVSGLGEDLSTWDKVVPDTARLTRTFAYDRSGLGQSETAPTPKSMEQMVGELETALKASGIKPPYVLVGHSLGGAIVELYACKNPSQIAGLVLVDPEDGRLLDQLQSRLSEADWDARQKMLDQMMSAASPAQKAELEASKDSGKLVEKSAPLPSVPTVLLTGTLKDPSFPGNPAEQDLKVELHKQLMTRIPHAKQVFVPNSRHYIQEDAPDLVINAIREVVEQFRGGATKQNQIQTHHE